MNVIKNYLWCYFIAITILYLYLFPVNSYIFNEWPIENYQFIGNEIYFIYILLLFPAIILPGYLYSKINIPNNSSKNEKISQPILLFCIVILIILLLLIEIYIGIDFEVGFNRKNRELEFFNTQIWVLFSASFVSIDFICIYFYKKLHLITKVLFYLLTVLYFYLEIYQLGGRRYSVTVLIFAFSVYIKNNNVMFISFKNILSLLFIGGILILYGSMREFVYHDKETSIEKILIGALTTNEFTAIGYGIYSILTSELTDDVSEYPNSILLAPLLLIPRAIWENKPLSIAHTIGVPISFPLELYINFNLFGILIYSIISIIIFHIGSKYRSSFMYCAIFAYIIDMTRGDFFGIIFITLITCVYYKCIVKNEKY